MRSPFPGDELNERPAALQQYRRCPVVDDRLSDLRVAQPREALAQYAPRAGFAPCGSDQELNG
jgi:hypothetical protein